MRLLFLPMLLGLASTATTQAATRPVVVELFTSQGWSSCPPADAYLTELAQAGRDVLPLAFHVTYWNRLGWRDPFSLDASTARQYAYSNHFAENSVFTPQMIVDGARSVVGSNRAEAGSAIQAAEGSRETAAAIHIHRDSGKIAISIGPGTGRAKILLIGFDHIHHTPVGRGENGGQTLTESNIVRSIRASGEWIGTAVTLSEPAPEGEDAAVLLQGPDGHITGAARL